MRQEFKDARALRIMECAELGMTVSETAALLTLNHQTVRTYGKKYSIAFVRAGKGLTDIARAEAMSAMFQAGKRLVEIGDVYGVTRERVRQVIKKHGGLVGKDGGQSAVASFKRIERRRREEAKYAEKHGCTPEQYREQRKIASDARAARCASKAPLNAFHQQRNSAKARGIGWSIKFWDWWTLWRESGKWEHRGRSGDGYVMCRFRDDGPYELGNVYIATLRHNSTVQPNNPYRRSHPAFEKAMADKAERHGQARKCQVEGCDREHYGHGMCKRHYDNERYRQRGFVARAA
jgi:predicted transcriptional regulator